MKAAVYMGPLKMEVKDVEKPVPKDNEVLIKVYACAVCGTDGRIYYHGQKNVVPPHIIGHEISGVIEECGKKVKGYKKGERVTLVTSFGCQKCPYCKKGLFNLCDTPRYIGYFSPGGFAEYTVVPEDAVKGNNILRIPENLSFDDAALIEPLSCVINGQEFLKIEKGDFVVVIGMGPIGCMHAELARSKGAGQVVMFDVADSRLELGKRFEGLTLINSGKEDPVKKVREMTKGRGADVVIVACGVPAAMEQALQMAAKRARVSFFAGLPKDNPYLKFDANLIHYNEISVFGAFASNRIDYEKAVELISKGKIDAKKFVTHRFPLDKIVEAIETAKKGIGLKVVITINR